MNSVNKPVYPLIPPQEMIQFMLKYSFFHKQVTQIPDSIIVSQKIDFDVMTEPVVLIPFGYPSDPALFDETPKKRKPIEEIIKRESF